jgi:hypothetical protein
VSFGAQVSWTATPVNAGSTPAATIAAVPHLGFTVISERLESAVAPGEGRGVEGCLGEAPAEGGLDSGAG